jgi:cell wall-associated NlpC family hydrolase
MIATRPWTRFVPVDSCPSPDFLRQTARTVVAPRLRPRLAARHHNRRMRASPTPSIRSILLLALCGLASYPLSSQQLPDVSSRPVSQNTVPSGHPSRAARTLTPDDGLAVIAAALDSHLRVSPEPDCSHLVHAIYNRAGFPYSYAPSSDLYVGTPAFRRVAHPQAGDLVVWQGHAGIVVNPAQHVFYSALRSGLGTDAYDAPYWKDRGHPRFYRYVKGSNAAARR